MQKRRLSAPGAPDDGNDAARRNRDRRSLEDDAFPLSCAIALDDIAELGHWRVQIDLDRRSSLSRRMSLRRRWPVGGSKHEGTFAALGGDAARFADVAEVGVGNAKPSARGDKQLRPSG